MEADEAIDYNKEEEVTCEEECVAEELMEEDEIGAQLLAKVE